METEDGLRRGAIIVVAKKWLGTCRAKSMYELGLTNSPEFLHKKTPEEGLCTP